MFYHIFFSPQVTQSAIISNKQAICELSHELLNDLKIRILGNHESSEKSKNFRELQPNLKTSENYKLLPSLPCKTKILSIIAKTCWINKQLEKKQKRTSFKCSVPDFLWKKFFPSASPQTPLNLISLNFWNCKASDRVLI